MTKQEILQELTLAEKLSMIHGTGLFHTGGVERLSIPPLYTSDGPMGVRREWENAEWKPSGAGEDYVSYMPSNSAIAATWNVECAEGAGRVLGEEARGRGKDVILAPGINVKRSPLCGRNFEYMSEDPYLISTLCVPLIKAIQESDVAACVKHFALNNQETSRLSVDTYASEQTLREIYLPGFLAAVKHAGSLTLMTAYNKVRGTFCSANAYLMKDIVREEWDYDGVIFSDWGGVHDTIETAKSPLDIEMSVHGRFDEYFFAEPLRAAIEKQEVPMECIDEKVSHILTLMERLHMISFDEKTSQCEANCKAIRRSGCYNTPEHHAALLRVAEESIVLLKNDGILPLDRAKLRTVLLVGENASRLHALGGGSAEIKALFEEPPILGVAQLLGGNVRVRYEAGYVARERDEDEEAYLEKNALLAKQAVAAAVDADAVIFVGGLSHADDVEGKDREDMRLPYGQEELISRLLDVRKDMVVCLIGGSPVELPFADRARALVWSYYAGMKTGSALARVLFGEVSPSGKLPESFPVVLADSPAHRFGDWATKDTVTYREELMVGYRYFATSGVKPRFAFGHGLSYTHFDVSCSQPHRYEDGDEALYSVTLKVTNTGEMGGAEVVQLYTARPELAGRPALELRRFTKLFLNPSEETVVVFRLYEEDFSVYDEEKRAFVMPRGTARLAVGTASDCLMLDTVVEI